jgi:hypothetical protein
MPGPRAQGVPAGAGSLPPSSGRTQLGITPKVTFCAVVGVNGSMEADVARSSHAERTTHEKWARVLRGSDFLAYRPEITHLGDVLPHREL